MNRNDEFTEWMKELDEQVPEVSESIRKGSRRKARKQFLYLPLMGVAAVFVLFVLSVNLCAPVAKAFSNVPVLKDLTKAVAFSKSLRAALENDYTQEVYQVQTKDGVTVEITSMIVDQQELIVFYRIVSEQYDTLAAEWMVPPTLIQKHTEVANHSHVFNYVPDDVGHLDEEIRYVRVLFFDGEMMPEKMPLSMIVWNAEDYSADVQAGVVSESNYLMGWTELAERYEVVNFEFEFELDLAKIPEPVIYEVNQNVELNGQKYTIKDIEVYPTYINMNMLADRENTKRLTYLFFYVENENGEVFENNQGKVEQKREFVAGAESSYFSEGKLSRIVITGAEWLEEGKMAADINLTTGEASNLPEDVSLKEIRSTDNTYDLVFEVPYRWKMDVETKDPFGTKCLVQPFFSYYDEEWNYYKAEERWKVEQDEENRFVGENGIYEVRLEDYPKEKVSLGNCYSSRWYAEQEVAIDIK